MKNQEYCICEKSSSVYCETNDFGQWVVCGDCHKVVEDSFEYFNHYDGEDHLESDLW
mgnify:CR=1 FL=1